MQAIYGVEDVKDPEKTDMMSAKRAKRTLGCVGTTLGAVLLSSAILSYQQAQSFEEARVSDFRTAKRVEVFSRLGEAPGNTFRVDNYLDKRTELYYDEGFNCSLDEVRILGGGENGEDAVFTPQDEGFECLIPDYLEARLRATYNWHQSSWKQVMALKDHCDEHGELPKSADWAKYGICM